MSVPLTAPGYLPAQAVDVLPWTRKYVVAFADRHHVDLDDCWEAAIAALIRATVHYAPGTGNPRARYQAYSSQAVRVALWRVVGYWLRGRFVRHRVTVPLEDVVRPRRRNRWVEDDEPRGVSLRAHDRDEDALVAPSAEEEAIARDSVRSRL